MDRPEKLREKLEAVLAECAKLRKENDRLRAQLKVESACQPQAEENLWKTQTEFSLREDFASISPETAPSKVQPSAELQRADLRSPPELKLKVFRALFRGREDVYAVRFIGRDGKPGYCPAREPMGWRPRTGSPSCSATPVPGGVFQAKPKADDPRKLLPLSDPAILSHLQGEKVIGIYPLLADETCWFLAADFDKAGWQENALAFCRTCEEWHIPAALERSRSGNGAHVWFFFAEPVPARLARQMGSAILTRTMERRHQLGLHSYDRFFPNQDTMPKGGFGNLIALPLQSEPRKDGNSVFVDAALNPYPDQWAYLSSIRRIRLEDASAIVQRAEKEGTILGIPRSETEEDAFEGSEEPWTLPPSRRKRETAIPGPFPERVQAVQSNLIFIPKEGLPSALLNRLLRLAAFQNPEFYRAQAMRRPVFGKPRIVHCGEELASFIALPRGLLSEATALLERHGIAVDLKDERFPGHALEVEFQGTLRPDQKSALEGLLAHDIGVLSATTAFGKTVVAAKLIAERKTNTLVLVHRRQLMDQWRARLSSFLNLPPKEIGLLGGGRDRLTGKIDVAIVQSLYQNRQVKDCVGDYGQIIVDECHHIGAFSFEQVLRGVKARYVVGLTATPIRKDGHHPIIMMQCGPIRYRVDAKAQAAARGFDHVVIPKITNFRLPIEEREPEIQAIYSALSTDSWRNRLIMDDVRSALAEGRSPIVLTERTEHLNLLAQMLRSHTGHLLVLKGGMGAKERTLLARQLTAIPATESRLLLATGRYAGEGFDDPRLDTLFLALPISWRGTLQQYVGRLHRLFEGKREVRVYDYVDVHVPMLLRMYERRLKGYRAMGYTVKDSSGGCVIETG